MPWIVVGCGYTGGRLVDRLVGAGEVVVATRRVAFAHPGARTAVVELGDRATLEGLPWAGATVACMAPPGDDPAGEMRSLARAARDAAHVVYVSSTGVYGPGYGAWVDEKWAVAPITATGRARADAEAALVAAVRVPLTVLRAAGIHGPGRGLRERIASGTYRIVGDGGAHVSRVHVDDLVSAIVLRAVGTYNVADDAPDPIGLVADEVARELGAVVPPRVAPETVAPEIAGMLTADRKIANGALKAKGWTLAHPTWRG